MLEAVRRIASDRSMGDDLPDEPPRDPSKLSWSAGSWDGVATHHADLGNERQGRADDIYARLAALARHDRDRDRLAVYRLAQESDTLQYLDSVLERIVDERSLLPQLAPHARWLITGARHRGPAKLGIALLGVCGQADDIELIKPFAAHDEFTLYCSVAFTNLVADPVDALWEAAKAANGWGKIQAVERLAPLARDRPDVQRWLLVDGCENSVMNEYLAYTCATGGGLAGALAGDVDDALLDGACTIVSALCVEDGPAWDLGYYEDGPVVTRQLLDLFDERCTTLARLETVVAIRRRLRADSGELEFGWTKALRDRLIATCDRMLARREWPGRVNAAFSTGDHLDQWLALELAPQVGVDLWDEAFTRLKGGPLDQWLVHRVVRAQDDARRQLVVAWAEANLPLHLVSTGPQTHILPEAGIRDVNYALTSVVGEMRDGDLYSERLIAAALRSPVIGTRTQALSALSGRPREQWGAMVETAVGELATDEPTEKVRRNLEELLN